MTEVETKQKIETALQSFKEGNLTEKSLNLFKVLGYNTGRQAPLAGKIYSFFKDSFLNRNQRFNEEKAFVAEWKYIDLLFQLSKYEMTVQHNLLDTTKRVDNTIIETYLFFVIELTKKQYSRTILSHVTREINKVFPMPAMILFKYGKILTLAVINRRLHKRDEHKDVLEKVTLIKDIRIDNLHRAHIEILFDLSFDELKNKHGFTNFVELHNAWQKTLDLKELNEQFYQKLFNWYLWAITQIKFPQICPEEDKVEEKVYQSESIIRLLTRLLFVWFMKEKGLINPALFDVNKLKTILKDFEGENGNETIYYKAILQNLFFATLNKPIDQRKVIDKGFNPKEYGDPLVYRFDDLFREPENFLSHFKNIPFLNGGLFECLDQKKDKDNPVEIRMDGFSTKKFKQAVLPDKLFFGEYKDIDLSQDYDNKTKNKLTVYGLIDILHQYKFTIEENTPIEEEVALDPELLGKVFENLLAYYNPETETTARKQTGSFYTPREIVNYMVDESLIAYLSQAVIARQSEAEAKQSVVEQRLRDLLSYSENPNPFNAEETHLLINAIDLCKILDPACGSGAFPMGVLQKMIHILHKLDPENKIWFNMVVSNFPAYMQEEVKKRLQKENWNYVRKLGIIQQCIYGVDIQPIATQIAKLRFFISLLVDQTEKPNEANRGIDPLPNLDFKIVTANTLISAPESDVVKIGLFENQTDPFFEEFNRLTGQYFSASMPKDKKELKNKIAKLISEKCNEKIRQIKSKYESTDERISKALKEKHKTCIVEKESEIKLWQSYTNLFKYESVGFFEPRYFFPKATEGFDIVIGNPPCGADIQQLFNVYKTLYDDVIYSYGEIYKMFYKFGIKKIKEKGTLAYITSNTFISQPRYHDLRKYLLQFNILKIVNLGLNVFSENVVVPVCICIISNEKVKENFPYADLSSDSKFTGSFDEIDFRNLSIPEIKSSKDFSFYNRTEFDSIKVSITFEDVLEIKDAGIQYHRSGIGLKNKGGNDLYERLFSDNKKSFKQSRQTWYGKLIGAYYMNPTTDEYFNLNYRDVLNSDETVSFSNEAFEKKKKILWRQTAPFLIATIDTKGRWFRNTIQCCWIKNEFEERIDLEYALALCNSKPMKYFYNEIVKEAGRVFPQVKIKHVKKLPFIIANHEKQKLICKCVSYLIFLNGADSRLASFFQRLIDAMVYELFLPEVMQKANYEVLKHLANLPELKDDWSNEKKLQTIEKVYKELSDPAHPVSIAMIKMQEVPEVKIIEGKA